MSIGGRSRRIPGVDVLEVTSPATTGVHDVWYGSASVVVKRGLEPSLLANEFICTRLAIGLGLPVPMGDAATMDESRAWVSAEVVLDGVVLPAVNPADIVLSAASDVAGICVFDVWVANSDRSAENVLYHPRVGLWAIDHERALGGSATLHPDHLARGTDAAIAWDLVPAGELSEVGLFEWAHRVRTFSSLMVDTTLREAQVRRLINGEQAAAIADFLSHRRRIIDHLIEKSIGEEKVTWLSFTPPGT